VEVKVEKNIGVKKKQNFLCKKLGVKNGVTKILGCKKISPVISIHCFEGALKSFQKWPN